MKAHQPSRRRFVSGSLAAAAVRLLPGVALAAPLLSRPALGAGRRTVGPRDLEIGFNWNKILSLHTHLRRLARSQSDPPAHYAEAVKIYHHQNFLVPGTDIWFSMERRIARCLDIRSVYAQMKLFPLEYRGLNLAPTGQAVATALESVLPAFEARDWPTLEKRRREMVDPLFDKQFLPLQDELLGFLFTSLNADPLPIRRLDIQFVGRYIQTGYRTRKISGSYFSIVETERFQGLDLLETVLMVIGRIIELEDRGNSKGAIFLLRERQKFLHLPNPALLPRAILYWTAGEAVRRLVHPEHEHVGQRLNIYQRAFRPFIPALEEHWNSYLSGQSGLDEALDAIIRKIGGVG